MNDFDAEQIKIMAGSVDPVEKTKEFLDQLGVTFPVAHSLDIATIAELTGAFYEEERRIIHPTDILVRPDKRIAVAAYSSGAVGRFVARDVLRLVKIYKSREK